MSRTAASLTLFFLSVFSLAAEDYSDLYNRARDAVYNQRTTPSNIHELISEGRDLSERSISDEAGRYYWMARFEYLSGRAYMEEDMATKKDFEKFRSDEAIVSFEEATRLLEMSLEIEENSDAYTLKADTLGQLCLLKGRSYTVSNGLNIRRMTEKALELDSRNGKALILMGNDRVYTPKIFGGSPKDGIELFEQAQAMDNIEKDDLFNIFSGIGVAWQKQRKKDEARFWMEKALAVYPDNIYIRRMIEEL